jgi:hypothetical protein
MAPLNIKIILNSFFYILLIFNLVNNFYSQNRLEQKVDLLVTNLKERTKAQEIKLNEVSSNIVQKINELELNYNVLKETHEQKILNLQEIVDLKLVSFKNQHILNNKEVNTLKQKIIDTANQNIDMLSNTNNSGSYDYSWLKYVLITCGILVSGVLIYKGVEKLNDSISLTYENILTLFKNSTVDVDTIIRRIGFGDPIDWVKSPPYEPVKVRDQQAYDNFIAHGLKPGVLPSSTKSPDLPSSTKSPDLSSSISSISDIIDGSSNL